MKRPLLVSAAGFVLGEVLILQEKLAWLILCVGIFATVLGILGSFRADWRVLHTGKKSRAVSMRISLLFFALLWISGAAGAERTFLVKKKMEREERLAGEFQGAKVIAEGRICRAEEKGEKWNLVLEDVSVRAGRKSGEFGKVAVSVPVSGGPPGALATAFSEAGAEKSGAQAFGTQVPLAEELRVEQSMAVGKRAVIRGILRPTEGARNPGEFDFKRYYRSKSIACRLTGEKLLEVSGEASPYFEGLAGLRLKCRDILRAVCEQEDAMIYEAVLLGDTASMDVEIRSLYQKNGIAHLLAISGQHLAILGGGIYVLLRFLGLGFGGAGLLGAFLVASYGWMTGGSGSALRAVFMICCLWLAGKEGRTYDSLSALGASAIFLLMKNPYLLTQSGFQLSFGAVAAIAGPGRWMSEAFGLEKGWEKTLAVSLAVQFVTAPIVLWHYFQYPVYGMFLNLLILPLVPILMYSGILVIFLGSFWQAGGVFAAGAGHYILQYYRWLCERTEKLPGYSLVTGRPEWGMIVGYALSMVVGAWALWWRAACCQAVLHREHREGSAAVSRQEGSAAVSRQAASVSTSSSRGWQSWKFLAFSAALFAASFWIFLSGRCISPDSSDELTVICLDVGQGDGIFLHQGNTNILIDGGSSSKTSLCTMTLEPFLKSRGVTYLDYAVVSHGDSDHISGLKELLETSEDVKIGTLVLPVAGKGQEIYQELEQKAEKRETAVWYMEGGERIQTDGLSLTCIYAGERENGSLPGTEERNSHSLVLCADYRSFHMLFTGDMGRKEEESLLKLAGKERWRMHHLGHVKILKTAHHGSAGSSSPEFLQAMPIKLSVISYGKENSYGHPAAEVLERFETLKIPVLKTGEGGAVLLRTDGERVTFGYIF